MAETPHSQEPQDDQASPPSAIGSYGAPSSNEGQADAPSDTEATDPGSAENPVLPLGYAPVSPTPPTIPAEARSATVAGYTPVSGYTPVAGDSSEGDATADLSAAPLAGSYGGGSIAGSYGGANASSYGGSIAGSYGAASIPTIGSRVEVPPLGGESAAGGEWDLLSGKLRDWFDRNDLGGQWDRLGGPLRASGLLLAGLILIKLYEALIDTLDDIPLLPRLLQLVGLLYLVNFGFTHLIKSQDRENLYRVWKKRWHDFTGRP
jgi:hypothetical protein